MKVTIYTVQIDRIDGEGWHHFATKKEAFAFAREQQSISHWDFDVTEDTTADLPPKQLAALLLNGDGWCAESKHVCTYIGRGQDDD